MGSLYVVAGREFFRSFTISSNETDNTIDSVYHKIENVRKFLDDVWPFTTTNTEQGTRTHADGRIGDIASITITFSDATHTTKIYRRGYGVNEKYSWTEEV